MAGRDGWRYFLFVDAAGETVKDGRAPGLKPPQERLTAMNVVSMEAGASGEGLWGRQRGYPSDRGDGSR